MASPVTRNDKRFSCWICKHFQPMVYQGEMDGSGECRALPPAACCVLGGESPKDEPVFPPIVYAGHTWCSAWMQRRNEESLGTIPPFSPG